VPTQLTPVFPAPELVALVAAWKFMTSVAVGALIETAVPALLSVAAPVTVTFPPPVPCRNALPLPPDTLSVPNVRVPAELF